jgi:hypothetical protein
MGLNTDYIANMLNFQMLTQTHILVTTEMVAAIWKQLMCGVHRIALNQNR